MTINNKEITDSVIVNSQYIEESMYTYDLPLGDLPDDFYDTLSTIEGLGWSTTMLHENSGGGSMFGMAEPKESFEEEKPKSYSITIGLQVYTYASKTIPAIIPHIKDIVALLPAGSVLKTYNKKKCENIYHLQYYYDAKKFNGLAVNVGF